MVVEIKFSEKWVEKRLPIIHLTKSRSGKTGTATFVFVRPSYFLLSNYLNYPLEEVSLHWEKKKIQTTDIKIIFYQGEPYLLKAIFLFKNSQDWFFFLSFMNSYSRETGLAFDGFGV